MQLLQGWTATLNAFIEDTCVIVSVTYLLSRGKTLEAIFSARRKPRAFVFGALLGLLGASEVVFPSMRAPYVSHTLAICLAALVEGWTVVFTAVAVVCVASLFLDPARVAVETLIVLAIVAISSKLFDRLARRSRTPLIVGVLGAGSQAVATLVCDWAGPALGFGHGMSLAPVSVLANGFGMFLIMLVIRDTDARALSEQSRLDLERVKTLQVAADLAALRARIRPHFLFNTLTALASLCNSDPAQAERSILKLSRLLRRTLAAETTALTNLEAEVEYLQAYVDIQTLRFGDGIRVKFALEPSIMSTVLPAFTLQTLVENSYQHGFAMRSGSGEIQVIGRKFRQSTLLAVWDSGVGMDSGARSDAIEKADLPRHGMGIIDKQLQLLFGPRARLRVFSRKGKGTLIAFQVPRPLPSEVHRTA